MGMMTWTSYLVPKVKSFTDRDVSSVWPKHLHATMVTKHPAGRCVQK